jgi:chemotaxis methyl-accepting protein methylase
MLFLSWQKSSYEFLKNLLVSNSLISSDFSMSTYDSALVTRAQELGFKNIEDYCRYAMCLPYDQLTREIRLIMLACRPLVLYQDQNLMEGISGNTISQILEPSEKKEESKNTTRWLKKVLKSDIKLKSSTNNRTINVLGIECSAGEEIYSAAIRLRSVLQDNYNINISGCDSSEKLLDEAKKGVFNQGKIHKLSDNHRSLYMENVSDEIYRVTDEIMDMIRFFKWDLIAGENKADEHAKYHMIFCGNIYRFYFRHIANRILATIVPCLTEKGLLFINADEDQSTPFHEGLDFYQLGKAIIYRRNSNKIKNNDMVPCTLENDTIENRLFFCKHLFFEGQLDEAQKRIDRILEESIDNLDANYLKADIYTKKEELDKAINQYSRVLIINPDFVPARYNLAALHLLNNNIRQAEEEIENLIDQIDSVEPAVIREKLNVGFGGFVELCRELKCIIESDKTPELSEILKLTESRTEENLKVPDIEIPDVFEIKRKLAETNIDLQESQQEVSGEKIKVKVSELPSTRDYGEDDPWLKKQKEEKDAEKIAIEETSNETHVDTDAEETSEDSLDTEVIDLQPETEKIVPTRLEKPAHALFLDTVSLDTLNLPKSLLDKYKPESKPVSPGKDDENKDSDKNLLPRDFLDSLKEYVEKQDVSGMKKAIASYLETAEEYQKEVLQMLDSLCGALESNVSKAGKKGNKSSSRKKSGVDLSFNEILDNLNLQNLTQQSSQPLTQKLTRKIRKPKPKV